MREFINVGNEYDAAGGDSRQKAFKKINAMTEELYGAIGGPTTVEWGNIDGNLPDQTDLDSALGDKADASALTTHENDTGNPHTVTAEQVGLGNVDNTADADKPVSTAQQAALDDKLTATQAAAQDDSTASDIAGLVSDFNTLLANLRSAGVMASS